MADEEVILPHREDTRRGHGEVALWSAVVSQAYADLAVEPLHSTAYEEAVAFCTAPSRWRESRVNVADFIGLHADDLERGARKIMAARSKVGERDSPKLLREARVAAFVSSL